MNKTAPLILTIAGLLILIGTPAVSPAGSRMDNFISISAPEMLYPVTDKVDLSGKPALEFRWRRRDLVNTDHYIFKLYQGYPGAGSQLIRKENVATGETISVPAPAFEPGQTYTWTLQQVLFDGRKSDIASNSFKIAVK